MEARAISKYQRISVKKANRILELIRGRNAKEALNILYFLPKPRHKVPILKALKSAIANAIYKSGKARLKEEDLYVKRFNSAGQMVWAQPLALCTVPGKQSKIKMAPINNLSLIH
ncbi:MAG: hypothetical protein N2323_04580, partial [candidate division WOR-3 bacterium]|nr:hypothetical protein [candidate division WOR-3 bacterium]